ncbi:spore germination protein [Priestia aryabhattai]|uniref:spore germination protein n=1 Tax=Priestia aryabhattai TaxID=412384 RepID=UPI00356683F9
MPYFIIVGNVLTNSITQNGNLDFGHRLHNSHKANSKLVWTCFSFDNTSSLVAHMINNNCDPDISDQGQVDNTSNT